MKFSSAIFLGLGLFVASCSAACNCKATDQACLDKCVIAANSCIVKCENQGDSCQEACITSNWPSAMPKEQKDVLADPSNSTSSAADAATTTGATMSATASMSVSVSTYPSTLSGGSTIMVTSTMSTKPTSSLAGGKSSSTPKNNMDNSNTSGSNKQAVLGWSVALAGVVGAASWMA
ncbi:hypothetical protein V8B55DRAFT_1588095 [Mucor lusitanicus]